ncbi:carboxylesterase 7 [Spatholobus suberectus]|nr:carboxylesterase 7 [Spatholobus suberectus]
MAAKENEITHEFRFFRVYKDGTVELFKPPADLNAQKIAPFDDPTTGVRSKDAVVSTHPPVPVRIFLPPIADPTRKLPLLLYITGSGFCLDIAFSSSYHHIVATAAAEANVIAVSVKYGLFPTRPIPGCYEDSWAALQWVASHASGSGPEPWLNDHADLHRVFIAGDSCGGNITHTLLSRVGKLGLPGAKVVGAVLVHPFFAGVRKIDEMWMYMCPGNEGSEDPRMKPAAEDLARLGCERVLVFVAENDYFFRPGSNYVEELKKSGWGGNVELIAHEFPFFRVYKDGTVELFKPPAADAAQKKITPFDDPTTGVRSKDAVVSTHPPVSVRIFLPPITDPTQKLPILLYMHGGGFCMQSAFSSRYHNIVANAAAEANVIAVSVEYGLFPTRPIPACYEDSWAALQWVASHASGSGPETWLNDHADLQRIFIGGDSAGGNITHTLVSRVGKFGLPGAKVVGAILVHPYFAGMRWDDEMWMYMCPANEGKMATKNNEITHEFPFFRVYNDGTVELLQPPPAATAAAQKIAPSDDPTTGVRSKDAVVSTHPPVSVRIFLPPITDPARKLPLLLYVHGGGFCFDSAFSSTYHNLVATTAAEANVIAVSVEYGLFPTRPIPACYEDSWAALQWVASHASGSGPEPWLNDHADLHRVFIAGDSAGGNITHTLVNWVGKFGLPGANVVGAILVHPYFGGVRNDDEMWMYMCPGNEGSEDPRMKPAAEDLARLGCERVLVFVAENDHLFHPGSNYVEELKKSGWGGSVELVQNWGLGHCFHVFDPQHDKAKEFEVALDFSPLLKVYKDGRVERLMGCDVVPPCQDPATNVESKDVVISKDDDVSVRIFIPKLDDPSQKLPLLVYFHGGAFCIETPSSPPYHKFLNSIVSKAHIVGVSVHYRRAPEHPVPIAYEDSWTSLKWVASHFNGNGPEEWLNRHADFGNVFFAGDSAGANIAHHMGIRVGTHGLPGVNLEGIALVHSYFWGLERDPNLGKLACKRVLVCVAENDLLKDRGWYYKELLEKCGWHGVVEVMEAKGEGHVFHLFNPDSDNAPLPIPSQKLGKPLHSTPPSYTMDSTSTNSEVAYDIPPILKVYKNGRIERLAGVEVLPPSLDPETNVESKDVVISEEDGISARLFIPKSTYPPPQKLPLLVYFHGGAFLIETPFSPNYHNLLNNIVSRTNVIGVSVHYRRAPEHPVPTCHEDSWVALKWVASHVGGNGPDEWLNNHADFGKVFFAGDSAGANIASYLGIRVGTEGLDGVKIEGIALVHPYFWGVEPLECEAKRAEQAAKVHQLWRFSCPSTTGSDDPIINPGKDPNLGNLACGRVLVCVAEKDLLKNRGWYYKELLDKSAWSGVAEVVETKNEDHVFHMLNPNSFFSRIYPSKYEDVSVRRIISNSPECIVA